MFTGIVEERGVLRRLEVARESARLEVEASLVLEHTKVGDSMLTDGVCLTVTALAPWGFRADAMSETVRRTTLAERQRGDTLNLERALMLSTRLGGHLVTGHVDGVGSVAGLRAEGNAVVVDVEAPAEVIELSAPRGSVALDGVSLTIVAVERSRLRVSLVPHTVAATTLASVAPGRRLNLEADLIARYVHAFVGRHRPDTGVTWERLREAGFEP